MLQDFINGTTILVDKPLNWTSFDVVKKLRWQLKKKIGLKKIKVGHAGTLDPLATGLLIICIGKNTKLIDAIMSEEKQYIGAILLGKTTASFDLETDFDMTYPTEHITLEMIENARKSFIGKQKQIPPIFSAKKIDGKRAYDLARSGVKIDLKENLINISDFKINATNFPELKFQISCSKGTYIRSIANDIGKKLNSGATLIELRRVASGKFNVSNAKSVDEWIEFIQNEKL